VSPANRCRAAAHRGYVLIEVLVSMLIFALGILGLISIQSQSVKAANEAKLRADAVFAANEILGKMWVDRANLATYAGNTTLSNLPGGNANVAVNGAVVTVTITWRPPGTSADRQFVNVATLVGN
jgi:type IV pilus assembly protein PilV